MLLGKEQIMAAKDINKEMVEVPEWGGEVYVKAMSGAERDLFEASMVKDGKTNMENIRARLCSLTICDENGHRLFNDKDALALGQKSAAALSRVFAAAQKLNGIGSDVVEEMEKN